MKRSTCFILFLVLAANVSIVRAQTRTADSLSLLIRNEKADTNKVNHLNSLAVELWGNLDTAIICSSKALEIAHAINWKKGIGRSKYLLGVFNFDKGNFTEALSYNSEAALTWQSLEENASGAEKQLYKLYRTKSIGEIGNAYYGLSNYPKALEYQFLALKLNQEMKREEGIAATCGNIGNIYSDQGDFPRALDYYKKSLKVSQKLGKLYDVSIDLRNIAIVYSKMDDAAKSLEYSMMALATSRKLGNDIETANNMCSVGSALLSQADSARARGKSYGELKE
jgi:tetratricopeptide (TPR) repeat protein